MLCRHPYIKGVEPFPCGQCTPCRINRRRVWTNRILLEASLHVESSFVTLTYSDEHLPSDASVSPKAAQSFMKRLRSILHRKGLGRIRFYLVGEYGDTTWRPHYHVALFGVSPLLESLIREAWPLGHVHVGVLTEQSAAYVAGYVTKKMTQKSDSRLQGRHPEFARMSLRPGIGAVAVPSIAAALNDREGAKEVSRLGDAPTVIRTGGRRLPLGRYLSARLRDEMGFEVTGEQPATRQARLEELRALRAAAPNQAAYEIARPFVDDVKAGQVMNRARIFSKKGSL